MAQEYRGQANVIVQDLTLLHFEAFVERSKVRETQKDDVPLWQRLKEVPVPLLLLYGAQDRGSAGKRCALLQEREPGLRVELLENPATW